MKALSTKQAAEKGSSEKGLPAARAFPVREPEGEEKVKDKGQGKEHSGNKEQAAELHHRAQEQQEHKKSQSAISCPRSHIVKTRSGNFRRGRIFHLNSRPLTGMGFREKRKFLANSVFERQSYLLAGAFRPMFRVELQNCCG
jgi:hypothetical protein